MSTGAENRGSSQVEHASVREHRRGERVGYGEVAIQRPHHSWLLSHHPRVRRARGPLATRSRSGVPDFSIVMSAWSFGAASGA